MVTWAIALGAAERARHYLETYGTGPSGIMLALCCSGVVFVAGAKLLDAVKRDQASARVAAPVPAYAARHRRPALARHGLRPSLMRRDRVSHSSLRRH